MIAAQGLTAFVSALLALLISDRPGQALARGRDRLRQRLLPGAGHPGSPGAAAATVERAQLGAAIAP